MTCLLKNKIVVYTKICLKQNFHVHHYQQIVYLVLALSLVMPYDLHTNQKHCHSLMSY